MLQSNSGRKFIAFLFKLVSFLKAICSPLHVIGLDRLSAGVDSSLVFGSVLGCLITRSN